MEKQSTLLCQILDKIGATGTARKWMKDTASTLSEIFTIYSFIPTETTYNPFVIVGSLSEGTYRISYESDIDILRFYSDIKLYESESSATGETYCIFEYIDSKPGYVYLIVKGKTPEYGTTIKVLPSGKKLLHRDQSNSAVLYRNGPADTTWGPGGLDLVQCVPSPWPSVAKEWFNRKRHYNWPSEETQQTLKDLSCIVVQAAHPDTPEHEKDIEWRLSFTLQENYLMCNLNDTQYKCYILLKMVKHDLITAKFGESLTSYHCKTALFYTIEQFPESIWRPENLIQCLVLCLLRLCLWTLVKFCPQYFMSTVDLFLGKVDKQIMPEMSETLQNIIKNPIESLKKLTCSIIGILFKKELSEVKCGPALTKLEEKAKQDMIELVLQISKLSIELSFMNTGFYNLFCKDIPIPSLMIYCLSRFESDKGKIFFLHHIVPSLYAFLASIQVAKSFRSDNHIERDWLFGAAALNFMNAMDGNNNIVARLRYVNALYATGHRESAASILDKVQSIIETYRTPSMTQEEVKTMPMEGRFECFLYDKGQSDMNRIFSTPLYTMLNMIPVLEIAFDINEIEIVPECIVFELFKNLGTSFPLSVKSESDHGIDVVNFHMYLKYLVKGDYESLKNNLLHERKSVAYYVKGWMFRERGYYLGAAQLFYQSWKTHEEEMSRISINLEAFRQLRLVCAAKLHLIVLIYELWRDRKELLISA